MDFIFDGKRCTGCKTCVLACKDNKDLSAEISFRKVYEYGGGTWSQSDGLWSNDAFGYYVSVACNHCDSPACMAKCPQGAISKDPDTGIVNNDPEKCIGCGTCAIACPYSAPKVDEEKEEGRALQRLRRARGRGREAGVRGGLPGPRPGLRHGRGDGEDGRARQHRSASRPVRNHPEHLYQGIRGRSAGGAAEIANPLEVA